MPSEEETARLVVPFGWPEGEGTGLDEQGMQREGFFGRRADLCGGYEIGGMRPEGLDASTRRLRLLQLRLKAQGETFNLS